LQRFDQIKEQIRSRVDLVGLVSEHTALKRRGQYHTGLCPFHQEKTPSFSVNAERQFFKCFGCGAGGDIFTFVQLRESVEFKEALQILADRAGVSLTENAPAPHGASRADLAKVNDWACLHFRNYLRDNSLGAEARRYLDGRGVTQDMIERFEIGLAPPNAPTIEQAARSAGYRPELLIDAGLRRRGDHDKDCYDTFRDRLMFPIRDAMRRCIGFGGRTLGDAKAKYLNTPETAQFDKSRVLFGLHLARQAMVETNKAVLVEGYFDCLAAHQHGFTNTVATLGTAATDQQMLALRRYCDEVILVFDSDAAGEAAADRALAIGLKHNLTVRLVRIPGQKDPADYLQVIGPQAFSHLLNSAQDALRFRWTRTLTRYQSDASAGDRKAAVSDFIGLIAELSGFGVLDAIQKGMVVGQVAELLSVSTRQVQALLEGKLRGGERTAESADPSAAGNAAARRPRPRDAEQAALITILGGLISEPGFFDLVADVFRADRIADPSHRRLAEIVTSLAVSVGEFSLGELMARMEQPEDAAALTDLITQRPPGSVAQSEMAEARGRLLEFAEVGVARGLTQVWKQPGSNHADEETQRDRLAKASHQLKRLASGTRRFTHDRAVQECGDSDGSL